MNEFLSKPSTDFNAVRDGRASMPLWVDVDLSVSRSIGATGVNVPLSLNIAGNSFYIDQDTANVGTSTVHFQDTNLGNASAPLFVSAGFIANVPFTQILIENAAQPGKRLRIFYGVDIDFQAGINASIAISGNVGINNTASAPVPCVDSAAFYTGNYASITPAAALTAVQIIAPGANANGVLIRRASFWSNNAGAVIKGALIAKNAAPATLVDGAVLCSTEQVVQANGFNSSCKMECDVVVPAGLGLYYITDIAEAACSRTMLYKVL